MPVTTGPGPGPRPHPTMIRLHLFDLDQPPEPTAVLRSVLDAGELARADRFRRPLDRERFVVGRALLRILVGGACDRAPSDVPIVYGPHGKPRMADSEQGYPAFGVTHTQNLLAVALRLDGNAEVGVDAEIVRPVDSVEGVAQRVFTAAEMADVVPAATAGDWSPFYRYWTAKEAVLKALGTGFSLEARAVTVRPAADATFRVEPTTEVIRGLPDRGRWLWAHAPGRSISDQRAVIALTPMDVDESVEVRPIEVPAPS